MKTVPLNDDDVRFYADGFKRHDRLPFADEESDQMAALLDELLSRRSLDGVEPDVAAVLRDLDRTAGPSPIANGSFGHLAARAAQAIRALASRSTRNAEVGVKALPWIEAALVFGGSGGLIVRLAPSPIGEFRVIKGSQGRFDGFIDRSQVTGSYDTIEAAQEALQADYDRRIRSALAITEPEREPVASGHDPKLVAALQNLREKLEALPEPLRGPFVVDGLKPYASPPAQEAVTDEMVAEAMHEAWNEICSDTGCHPLDIERHGKELFFHPLHWSRFTAMHLREALQLGKEG